MVPVTIVLDAVASRIDDENGYSNVIKLVGYLAAAWRTNERALNLVLTLTGPRPKARDTYDYDSVMAAVLPALTTGWAGNPNALAFLKQQAAAHSKASLRSIALQKIAAGWSNNTDTLEFLKLRAEGDPDPQTRAVALEVIGEYWDGDEEAFSFLMKWAKNSLNVQLRLAALEALELGWGDTDKGFNFFKERAVSDPDPSVRKAGLKLLSGIEYVDVHLLAISSSHRDDAVKVLCDRGLHEPELAVRESVFELLLFLFQWFRSLSQVEAKTPTHANHQIAIVDFLKDRATNDSEPRIRSLALHTLERTLGGYAEDEATRMFLKKLLSS